MPGNQLTSYIESLLRGDLRTNIDGFLPKLPVVGGVGVSFGSIAQASSAPPPETELSGIFVIPYSEDAPSGWGPIGLDPWVVGGSPNGVKILPNVSGGNLVDYTIETGAETELPAWSFFNDWTRSDFDGYLSWRTGSADRYYDNTGSGDWVFYKGKEHVRYMFKIIQGACITPDEALIRIITYAEFTSPRRTEFTLHERPFDPLEFGINPGVYDPSTNPTGWREIGVLSFEFDTHISTPANLSISGLSASSLHFNASGSKAVCTRQVSVLDSDTGHVYKSMAGVIRFDTSSTTFSGIKEDNSAYLMSRYSLQLTSLGHTLIDGCDVDEYDCLDSFSDSKHNQTIVNPINDAIIGIDFIADIEITATYHYSETTETNDSRSGDVNNFDGTDTATKSISTTGTTTHIWTLPWVTINKSHGNFIQTTLLTHDILVQNGSIDTSQITFQVELTHLDLRYNIAIFSEYKNINTVTQAFIDSVSIDTTTITSSCDSAIIDGTEQPIFTAAGFTQSVGSSTLTSPISEYPFWTTILDHETTDFIARMNSGRQSEPEAGDYDTAVYPDGLASDKYGGTFTWFWNSDWTFDSFGNPTRITPDFAAIAYFTPAGFDVVNYLSMTGVEPWYEKLSLW